MQLVTSCPACDTRFHVKPEQLAVHAGDVQCGQCQQTFNAGTNLYRIIAPQSLPVLANQQQPHQVDQDHDVSPGSIEPLPLPESAELDSHTSPIAVETSAQLPEETLVEEVHTGAGALADINVDQGESVDTGTDTIPSEETIDSSSIEEPEILLQPIASDYDTPPARSTSFLSADKPAKKRWISAWLTIPLSLLLILGALAQAAYFFRSEIAGHWPASRPTLISACEWLGCTVPLARNPELLALDDSDLQEDFEHPEVIQLATKLINNASYTQAFPMLELTLTDDEDQPKLRRVFKPEEYLPSGTDINAGMHANEEIQINLSFSTSGETVSGYRVFVTY